MRQATYNQPRMPTRSGPARYQPQNYHRNQEEDVNDVSVASNGSGKAVEAKLPKLELPCFSGEVTMWTSFWEQFVAALDDNCELPDITKFSYQLSLLKREAMMAVQSLSLTAANYRTACEILGKRYSRPERIIFSHLQELLTLSVPRKPSVTDLWRMYDDLQAHVRSLDALGISGEHYGVVLTPLILSRLTPELRLEWARDGEQHESDLLFLLNRTTRAVSGILWRGRHCTRFSGILQTMDRQRVRLLQQRRRCTHQSKQVGRHANCVAVKVMRLNYVSS